MKDIFLCLLVNLKNHGRITSASMDEESGSKITLIDESGKYQYKVTVDKSPVEGKS